MITIRIVGYTTHRYVVDNYPDIGINARKGKACRRVEGHIVLIAALDAVNLDGRIIEPDGARTPTAHAGVIIAQRNAIRRACRRAKRYHAVVVVRRCCCLAGTPTAP